MSTLKKLFLVLGDAVLFYVALGITILLRYPLADFEARLNDHILPFSVLLIAWIIIFWLLDLYRQRAFVNYNALANKIAIATTIAAISSIVLFYLFEGFFRLTPKTNLFIFALALASLEYAFRSTFLALARFRPQPAIIIGDSKEIHELMDFLKDHPHAGFKTSAWMESLSQTNLEKLPQIIKGSEAYTLIVQPSLTKDPLIVKALYDLLPLGVSILNFPDFYELVFERVPLDNLEEGWFIEHVATRRPSYDQLKRIMDFTLSTVAFAILLPLSAVIALLIRLTSKGPAVFTQNRVGKNDIVFKLYKFRTMNTWTGGTDGTPAWTEENDPRVTFMGKILRYTHLDEIPQLWNIILGDISFTGPRPERVELADQYRAFPYYNIRHVVKPGLTGWAQINYKPSASLEEGKEKLKYDIFYIKNRSFFLDLAIILKTIRYIFSSPS